MLEYGLGLDEFRLCMFGGAERGHDEQVTLGHLCIVGLAVLEE